MALFCGLTEKTKDSIQKSILQRIKEKNLRTPEGIMRSLWNDILSKLADKEDSDYKLYYVNIAATVPQILREMYSDHKLVDENGDPLIKDSDIIMAQNKYDVNTEWYKNIRGLLGLDQMPFTSNSRNTQIRNAIASSIPVEHASKTSVHLNDEIIEIDEEGYPTNLFTVQNRFDEALEIGSNLAIKESDVQPRKFDFNPVANGTVIPLKGNVIEENLPIEFEYVENKNYDIEDRSKGRAFEIFIKQKNKRVGKVYYTLNEQGDSQTSLPTSFEAAIINIMSFAGTIKDPKSYNRLFGKINGLDRSSGRLKVTAINPLIIDHSTPKMDIEASGLSSKEVENQEMFTVTDKLNKIFPHDFNRVNESNKNKELSDAFYKNIEKNGSPVIDATPIKLQCTYEIIDENKKIILKAVDSFGEVLKFKLNENKELRLAKEDEEGEELIFDMWSFSRLYNFGFGDAYTSKTDSLGNTIKQKIINYSKQILGSVGTDEQLYNYFVKIALQERVLRQIVFRHEQKIIFDITGLASTRHQHYNNDEDIMDYNGEDVNIKGQFPSVRVEGLYGNNSYSIKHDVLSEEYQAFITKLLTNEPIYFEDGTIVDEKTRVQYINMFFGGKDNAGTIKINDHDYTVYNNSFVLPKIKNNGYGVQNNYNQQADVEEHLTKKDKYGFPEQFRINYGIFKAQEFNMPIITVTDGKVILKKEKGNYKDLLKAMNFKITCDKNAVSKQQVSIRFNIDMKENPNVKRIIDGSFSKTQNKIQEETKVEQKQKEEQNKYNETGFFRTKFLSEFSEKATKEQSEEAKEWFDKSPLKGVISFEDAIVTANATAVASWSSAGITLTYGSDYADLYHEAFHKFSQLYLTKDQKEKLYNDIRNSKSKFTTHNGEKKKFSDATDLEIEEYLAEGFRTYMLKNGKPKGFVDSVKKFFNRLKMILLSFFGKNQTYTKNELYSALRFGNIGTFQESESNIMFSKLYRGIPFTDGSGNSLSSNDSYEISEIMDAFIVDFINSYSMNENLNYSAINDYVTFITNVPNVLKEQATEMKNELYNKYNCNFEGISDLLNNYTKEKFEKFIEEHPETQVEDLIDAQMFYNRVSKLRQNGYDYSKIKDSISSSFDIVGILSKPELLQKSYQHIFSSLLILKKQMQIDKKTITDKFELAIIERNINLIDQAIINYGDTTKVGLKTEKDEDNGAVGFHYKQFNSTIEFEDEDSLKDNEDEDEDITLERYDAAPNEKSTDNRIGANVIIKYILSILPSYSLNDQGKYVADLNSFGLQRRKDYQLVKNKLNLIWNGSRDTDEMYMRLKEVAAVYPTYKVLLEILGNPSMNISDKESDIVLWDNMTMEEKINHDNTWNQLFEIFGVCSVPMFETVIEEDFDMVEKENNGKKYMSKEKYISSRVQETSGPRWKMITYYQNSFLSSISKYILDGPYGNQLNIDAIVEDFYSKIYVQDTKGKRSVSPIASKHIMDLVRACGINITPSVTQSAELRSIFSDNEFPRKLMDKLVSIRTHNTQSQNKIIITDPVAELFLDYNKEAGYRTYLKNEFYQIIDNDLKYNENVNVEMCKNAEGEIQFRNQLNNSISMLFMHLNNCNSIYDVANNPALAHFVRITDKEVVINGQPRKLVELTPNVDGSMILKNMFNLQIIGGKPCQEYGTRNKSIKLNLVNYSGVKIKKDNITEGINLFGTDIDTKVISDFSMFLKGHMELMRHADKKVSYGMNVDGLEFLIGVDQLSDYFTTGDMFLNKYERQMMFYLAAEINKLKKAKKIKQEMYQEGTSVQHDEKYINKLVKNDGTYSLGFFDDMLSEESKQKIFEIINDDKELNKEVYNSFIKKDLKEYFYNEFNKNFEMFSKVKETYYDRAKGKNNMIKNIDDEFFSSTLKQFQNKVNDEEKLEAFVVLFTANNLIYNIESIKLIYGDIVMFNHDKDELTKRIGGMGSSGKVFNVSESMRQKWDTVYWDSSYMKQNGYENTYNTTDADKTEFAGYLKTAIAADVNSLTPEWNEYVNIFGENSPFIKHYKVVEEETNAQAFITFDAYRYMCIAEGKWSNQKESLFQKISQGQKISYDEYEKYFPILKLQYEGPLYHDELPIQAFHKYALLPLIPSMIKDKNLEIIHDRMMKEGIHYLTFNSGSKLGNISRIKTKEEEQQNNFSLNGSTEKHFSGNGDRLYKPETINYNDRNGNTRQLAFDKNTTEQVFTPNYIPIAYLKDQVEIHNELENEVIFSTQMRRLIENNMFENGVPKDWNGTSEEWSELSAIMNQSDKPEGATAKQIHDIAIEKQNARRKMEEGSNYYRLAKQYETYISKLTEFAINDIKEMFDMNKTIVDGQIKVIEFLRKEFEKKGVPAYVIKDDATIDQLQFSFYSNVIENIVISLINRKVIRQHIHGGQYVQVAGTFFEDTNGTIDQDAANDLPFYKVKKDSTTKASTCKLPLAGDFVHLLNAVHIDGHIIKTRERLNECLKDEKWAQDHAEFISVVACRIPVQGHNSMEYMTIAEFLEPGSNNIVVCPTELVIKSGGDYDVDKLSMILPNITTIKGRPSLVKFASPEEIEGAKHTIEVSRNQVSAARSKISDLLSYLEKKSFDNDFIQTNVYDRYVKYVMNNTLLDERIISINEDLSLKKEEKEIELDKIQAEKNILLKNFLQDIASEPIFEMKEVSNIKFPTYKETIDLDEHEKYLQYLNVAFTKQENRSKKRINKETETARKLLHGAFNAFETINYYRTLEYNAATKLRGQSRQAYENSMISIMTEILSLPCNNKTLITENTNILYKGDKKLGIEGPASEMEKSSAYNRFKNLFSEETEHMSPTRAIEYRHNLAKHDDFNTGKTILGPSAIDNVFSSIARRVGLRMNYTTTNAIATEEIIAETKEQLYELERQRRYAEQELNYRSMTELDNEIDLIRRKIYSLENAKVQRLLIPHNKVKVKYGDNFYDCIDLSSEYDAEHKYTISEVISEYINGCVDVAKDPWIKYIQGNKEMIPNFMFLIQAGVPLNFACFFVSNPLVVDYVNEKLQMRSPSNLMIDSVLNKVQIRAKALGIELKDGTRTLTKDELIPLIDSKIKSLLSKEEQFDFKSIKKLAMTSKEKMNDKQLKMSKRVLAHFIEIEDMASSMNSLKLAVRVDATKNNTIFDIISKQKKYHEIEEDERIPKQYIDAIRNESVISSFFIESFAEDLIRTFLPAKMYEPLLKMSMNEARKDYKYPLIAKERISQTFENEFFSFLVQRSYYNGDSTIQSNDTFPDEFWSKLRSEIENRGVMFTEKNFQAFRSHLVDILNMYDIDYSTFEGMDLNKYIPIILTNFAPCIKNSLYKAGIASAMFKGLYNFPTLYSKLKKDLQEVMPTFISENPIFRYLTVSKLDNVINLYFNGDVDANILEMVKSNFEELTKTVDGEDMYIIERIVDDFDQKLKTAKTKIEKLEGDLDGLDDQESEEIKKQIENAKKEYRSIKVKRNHLIMNAETFFENLKMFSFFQSGMNSGKKSLNPLFDLSNVISERFNEFVNMDETTQYYILHEFLIKFMERYSSGENIYRQDVYEDIKAEDEMPILTFKEVLDSYSHKVADEELKDINDLVMHSGGARGADSIFSDEMLKVVQRKPNQKKKDIVKHYRYPYGKTPEDKKRSLDISEFNNGFNESEDAVTVLTKEQMDEARTILNDYMGQELVDDSDSDGKNTLKTRNFFQVINSSEVFAIVKLNPNMIDVDGGTKYAVKIAQNLGKPIYVFNVLKDEEGKYDFNWYSYNHTLGRFEKCKEKPVIHYKNFAGIGTRDIELYDGNVEKYLGDYVSSVAITEIKNLFQRTKAKLEGTKFTEKITPKRVKKQTASISLWKISRKIVESDPTTLYVFTDNTNRTSGNQPINPISWYAQKYGKSLMYPKKTSAQIRGLENAMPISTQHFYKEGDDYTKNRWKESEVKEFRKVISAELKDIDDRFKNEGFKRIVFVDLFSSGISDLNMTSRPNLTNALLEELDKYGYGDLFRGRPETITNKQKITIDPTKTYDIWAGRNSSNAEFQSANKTAQNNQAKEEKSIEDIIEKSLSDFKRLNPNFEENGHRNKELKLNNYDYNLFKDFINMRSVPDSNWFNEKVKIEDADIDFVGYCKPLKQFIVRNDTLMYFQAYSTLRKYGLSKDDCEYIFKTIGINTVNNQDEYENLYAILKNITKAIDKDNAIDTTEIKIDDFEESDMRILSEEEIKNLQNFKLDPNKISLFKSKVFLNSEDYEYDLGQKIDIDIHPNSYMFYVIGSGDYKFITTSGTRLLLPKRSIKAFGVEEKMKIAYKQITDKSQHSIPAPANNNIENNVSDKESEERKKNCD